MATTYLVTGVAGFIGSHVADALLARGDQVIGVDNLNDYYDPASKKANLDEVTDAGHPGDLTFAQGDVRDPAFLDSVLDDSEVATIVHLAAMAGVRPSIDAPDLYYDVNLSGTLYVLDAAIRHGIRHVVFASTSSVYGKTDRIPFVETDTCDRPLVPYSASKRAAEMLGFSYHNLHGLSFTGLRFFTVYGPRGRPDMMAFKVAESVRTGRPLPLFNGGDMLRDWTFITDIVSGVVAAIDRPMDYELINLGRGGPVSLSSFVSLIEERMGKKAALFDAEVPVGDVPRTFASIDKARDLLGYSPQVDVRDGVQAFLEWYETAVPH